VVDDNKGVYILGSILPLPHTHTHAHTHTPYVYTHLTYTHTLRTHKHTVTHTHTHTYTHMHTHTHTHTQHTHLMLLYLLLKYTGILIRWGLHLEFLTLRIHPQHHVNIALLKLPGSLHNKASEHMKILRNAVN